MWHLIVPPIVVVACFTFLVWYLSLRGADPEVTQKIETNGDTRTSLFRSSVRSFFLRVLERLVQRFKVLSLQMHNLLHTLLQSVKAKRRLSDNEQQEAQLRSSEAEYPIETKAEIQTVFPTQGDTYEIRTRISGGGHVSRPNEIEGVREREDNFPASVADLEQDVHFNVATPLLRRRRNTDGAGLVNDSGLVIRPMVSEQGVRPEPERLKRKVAERPIEEGLIARIAANPKEYTAYEALGDFYMERGSIQDAKECYKQVLKLSPAQRLVKIKIRRLERLLSQK